MKIAPEDLRTDLARKAVGDGAAAGVAPGADAPATAADGLPPLSDSEKALLASISASYFWLRIGLASLALAFPILLWFFAGGDLLGSISAYYHEPAGRDGPLGREPRDVFVGVLCAIGAFLYLYKGYRWEENLALNVAGIAAAAIALFPTDLDGRDVITVHGAAAVTYFLAIAYVCLFRARDTLDFILDGARRRWFARLYKLLGAAMVLLPLAVLLIHNVRSLQERAGGMVFWIELAAIYVFASFWAAKSLEIRLIERQRQEPAPAGVRRPSI
jgi:hypothetical protein